MEDETDDMQETLALLHSDGSIGLLAPGSTWEKAREEQAFVNHRETRPEHLTKIGRVQYRVLMTLIEDPAPSPAPCPCGRHPAPTPKP